MDEVYVLIEHKIDDKEICGVFESHAAAWQAAQALWRRRCAAMGLQETPLRREISPWRIYGYTIITEAMVK